MRSLLILLCLGLLLAVTVVKCQERGRRQQRQRAEREVNLEPADEGDEDEEEEEDEEDTVDVEAVEAAQKAHQPIPNPCVKKKCRRGEQCKVQDNKAVCVCDTRCVEEVDRRYWVCSTKNVSFPSECHLDREHCLCKRKNAACQNPAIRKVDLDYYGQCIDITPCPKEEFEEFPRRLKDWFFIIMKQLAQRKQLGEYLELLRAARDDENHTDATLWKFCDLDVHPQDRQVSRRELQYTTRSLKAFEHCLAPFLNFCDSNNNRKISLTEWGACLGVDKAHIIDKCKEIHSRGRRQRK